MKGGIKVSNSKTFYVIKDLRTHGYYMRTDKEGATWWSVSPFIAKKFKSRKEAQQERENIDNSCVIVPICYTGRGC